MDWETFKNSPHLVLAAAIVVAALVIGGVMLKISNDNRCKPVAVQHSKPLNIFDSESSSTTYETLDKPPGC